MSDIRINEEGVLVYEDGSKVNTRDYLLTKPYIKRYYDYNTKNASAINLYVLLKKLGVKNCNEHLQIFNPQLIGVDPWDPLLKDSVKMAIIQECRHNYWYIYREILKVDNGTAPFDINIFNYTAIYFMLRNINFFLEASRQLGKTQVIATHSALEHNFGRHVYMAVAHYDAKMGVSNIGKIEEVLEALPSWMQFYNKRIGKKNEKTGQQEIKAKTRTASKRESLNNEIFDNVIELQVVGQVESKANNTGRGTTIPIWFLDELAHTKHNKIAFESLNQSTKQAKVTAQENDRPFGFRLLGTPGKLETKEGTWMLENIQNRYIPMNEQTLEVLDMTEEEINEWGRTKSIDGIFHIKYDFDKIGKGANWFSDRCAGQSIDGIRSELLLIWEDTSSASPFPATELASLTNYSQHKKSKTYNLKEWIPGLMNSDVAITIYEVNNEMYDSWVTFFSLNFRDGIVVGVDTSRGLGGPNDSTVFSFVDAKTGSLIALIKDNTLEMNDLILLTKGLCEIAIREGIKMAFSIERNDGTSNGLIQSLKYMPHIQPFLIPFPVASWKLDNPLATNVDFEYRDEYGQLQKSDFGYAMDSRGRDRIMSLIQLLVRKYTRCICIEPLIDELKSLVVYTKKGTNGMVTKIAAASGKHDDIVMSVGHAYHALYYHANILRRRHGIETDPKKWLINEGRAAFSFANRPASSRITVTFKEIDGKFEEVLYDNKYNKIITPEEADKILSDNKVDRYTSDSNYKEPEEVVIPDEVLDMAKDHFKEVGSSNIKVISEEEYKLHKAGLGNSNNIYNDNMNIIMNEFLGDKY